MFGKVIGFIVCVVIGLGITILALISDSMICSNGVCYIKSYISKLNINISEDRFSRDDIKNVSCVQKSQPSRRGKKSYYLLVLTKDNGTEYNLGSYKNYSMCKSFFTPVEKFVKGKSDKLSFDSGFGFANSMGIILGVVMFFIAIIILTSKTETVEYDWEDEDS